MPASAAAAGSSTATPVPPPPPPSLDMARERQRATLEAAREFLHAELTQLFTTGAITSSRYSPSFVFRDPLTSLTSLEQYRLMLRALRTLFNVDLKVHSIYVSGPRNISSRWTMTMEAWPLPWRPQLLFTGTSLYEVDPDSGILLSHTDTWDALSNGAGEPLSLEAVALLLQQLLDLQLTPDLETPTYEVLRAARDYELRRYAPFLVAETPTPPGAGASDGSGFTELATYIFGGNTKGVRMEMTTPVLTGSSGTMQFVMERRFDDPQELPAPRDARIGTRAVAGGAVAALRFSGWPFEWEVTAAERKLRSALLRDGLKPEPGFRLARYNEPTVPPFLRRNEVLIALQDFTWP